MKIDARHYPTKAKMRQIQSFWERGDTTPGAAVAIIYDLRSSQTTFNTGSPAENTALQDHTSYLNLLVR